MLRNITNGAVLARDLEIADTFFRRLRGLMFRRRLGPGHALLLSPCNSIHTCFMRFAIDVLFLDYEHRIVHIAHSVPPFRLVFPVRDAVFVLELAAGTAADTCAAVGDEIDLALIVA